MYLAVDVDVPLDPCMLVGNQTVPVFFDMSLHSVPFSQHIVDACDWLS